MSQAALGSTEPSQNGLVWSYSDLKVLFSQPNCRRLASVHIIAQVLLSIKLHLVMDNEYTTYSAWDH